MYNGFSLIYFPHLLRVTDIYDFFAFIKISSELNTSSSHETYFDERIKNIQTIHNHFTRFGGNCNIISLKIQNSIYYASFLYKSINLWNNLPLNIKNSISLNMFTNSVRAFLLDNMAVQDLHVHAFVRLYIWHMNIHVYYFGTCAHTRC